MRDEGGLEENGGEGGRCHQPWRSLNSLQVSLKLQDELQSNFCCSLLNDGAACGQSIMLVLFIRDAETVTA